MLSLTRDADSKHHVYHPRSYSPKSHTSQNKAFTKSTVAWQPPHRSESQHSRHSLLDHDESSSPLDTPAPRARAPRPTINKSDIEIKAAKSPHRSKSRSPKRSPTRSPKRSPVRDRQGILNLLEVLSCFSVTAK